MNFYFRAQFEDGQLCTSAMREFEKTQNQLNLLHKYEKCIIRIHFPNRLVLQTIFKSTETVLDIMNFIRKYLVDEFLEFCLCKNYLLNMKFHINFILKHYCLKIKFKQLQHLLRLL